MEGGLSEEEGDLCSRHKEKTAVYQPGRGVSLETNPDGILDFQPPELREY